MFGLFRALKKLLAGHEKPSSTFAVTIRSVSSPDLLLHLHFVDLCQSCIFELLKKKDLKKWSRLSSSDYTYQCHSSATSASFSYKNLLIFLTVTVSFATITVCFRSLRQAYRVRKASSPYSTLIEGHYDAFYVTPRFTTNFEQFWIRNPKHQHFKVLMSAKENLVFIQASVSNIAREMFVGWNNKFQRLILFENWNSKSPPVTFEDSEDTWLWPQW